METSSPQFSETLEQEYAQGIHRQPNRNMFSMLVVALIVIIPIAGLIGFELGKNSTRQPYMVGNQPSPVGITEPSTNEPVVCTMEAKLCPDGSYVGRTGPHCEFSACPATSTTTSSPSPRVVSSPKPTPKSIRTFTFKQQASTQKVFTSGTGYSFFYAPVLTAEPEKFVRDSCVTSIASNLGGIIGLFVSSSKPAVQEEPTYTYIYEDVMVLGKKSQIIEQGPPGESGSSTTVIIPFTHGWLKVFFPGTGKDDGFVKESLESIQAKDVFPDACGK